MCMYKFFPLTVPFAYHVCVWGWGVGWGGEQKVVGGGWWGGGQLGRETAERASEL